MQTEDRFAISAVSREHKLALTCGGEMIAFAAMLNAAGVETDDVSACVVAILQFPCGTWTAVDLADFVEPITLH